MGIYLGPAPRTVEDIGRPIGLGEIHPRGSYGIWLRKDGYPIRNYPHWHVRMTPPYTAEAALVEYLRGIGEPYSLCGVSVINVHDELCFVIRREDIDRLLTGPEEEEDVTTKLG